MKQFTIRILVALFFCYGCSTPSDKSTENPKDQTEAVTEENPALPGFNESESDPKAIAIADEVMKEMGGRKAWDNMKTISWNFFGARKLVWDKPSGKVRVDNLRGGPMESVIINLNDTTDVQLKMNGELVTNSDSLGKYGGYGKAAWINDAYWVVMPFKLKDSGVTLRYVREDTTLTGEPAHILQLTFSEVGVTPQNRYEVYVSKERKLVAQWAFYRVADQQTPDFNLPWGDYKEYSGVLLATDRGERDITELEVMDTPPEGTFNLLD